jgi:hypothetical protein
MTLEKPMRDSYKILEPTSTILTGFNKLDEYSRMRTREYDYWTHQYKMTDSRQNKTARNLSYAVSGQVTMKMLAVYADGNEHHYDEVCQALDLAYGHDIDCWRSLIDRSMIGFSSKKAHGRKYYTITDFGKEVLRVVEANQVYFRVARWYKVKGEDVFTAMMKADLAGEESWKDLLPESLAALLDALCNPSSNIRQLGSAYRWMNNFMYLLKTNDEFYQKIDCPEVLSWLQQNESRYPAISRFLKIFNRMQKKRAKAA